MFGFWKNNNIIGFKMRNIFWEDWASTKINGYIELILHPLCCLIILILMIIYVWIFELKNELCCCKDKSNEYKSRKNELYQKIPKLYKRLLFASLIISGINIFGNLWMSNLSILLFDVRDSNHCFYRTLLGITVLLQRNLTYYFFISRLKLTFVGSAFAIKDTTYYIGISLAFISSLVSYSALVVLTRIHSSFTCASSMSIVLVIVVLLIIDSIVQILLTVIFIGKLNGLIKLTNIDDNKSASDSDIKRQIKLRLIVSKLTILCLVTVITTLIFSIIIGNIARMMTYQSYAIDLIINNICMMLSFAVLAHPYNKLCYPCILIQKKCTKQGKIAKKLEIQLGNYVNTLTSQSKLSAPLTPKSMTDNEIP